MINIPQSGQTQLTAPTALPPSGAQRTIVLTPPAQANSNSNGQQQFPMLMQVGGNNQPVLVYQNSEQLVNTGMQNNCNENLNTANPPALGQVVLSPVSPVQTGINVQQNASSPTIPQAVSMQPESKCNVSRSLNDLFNMQAIATMPNLGAIVHSPNVAINPGQSSQGNSELAGLLTSLQAAGLQIIDAPNRGGNTSSITVPVVNNHLQGCDVNRDKSAMTNFINTLQSSGVQVVENNSDKTLLISIPSKPHDKQFDRNASVLRSSIPGVVNKEHIETVSDSGMSLAGVSENGR